MTNMNYRRDNGAVNTWVILTSIFIFTTVAAVGVMVWALLNYFDQKNNVDSIVTSAVTDAVKEQADKDAAAFEAEEKKPNRTFSGPEDYGGVTFEYPKTWSTYVAKDASSGNTYQAYLNPVAVPPITSSQQFGLRVTIQSEDYDDVLKDYESEVEKGDLKSSVVKASGQDGTRLDGTFSKDIRGSAVIFKIRDKTLIIQTDALTFKNDFDAIVKTIKFNQ
jgi:hypothetical protein